MSLGTYAAPHHNDGHGAQVEEAPFCGEADGTPPYTPEDRVCIAEMGQRLRWVRDAYGLSQEAMAEMVGIHQTTWGYYERGERWPSRLHLVRMAGKLRITVKYLDDGDLTSVDPTVAIHIALAHPELKERMSTVPHRDTDQS